MDEISPHKSFWRNIKFKIKLSKDQRERMKTGGAVI